MLKNYFKLAYRSLLRNKLAALFNVFGLSVAIGTSILVYLFLDMQYSMDSFHPNADRIFLVGNIVDRDGGEQVYGDSPMPLGPAMETDFPQVEEVVRVAYGGGVVQYGERVFREGVWFVDPEFFDFFNFPLQWGDKHALFDDNSIILSESSSKKYFGDDNPVGRQVTIKFNDTILESFVVKGVAERFPEQASFKFDFLISFNKQRSIGVEHFDDWKRYIGATFVRVKDPQDIPAISSKMGKYVRLQNAANGDWPVARYTFDNLRNLSVHSFYIRSHISNGTHPAALYCLPIIAVLLLALSCLNYMNVAIATAARRLKEIGVRKVVGSSRMQLIAQLLGENLLLCALALLFGILIAHFLLLPSFNTFFEGWPQLVISFGDNTDLWWFLVSILALTAISSGAYPAFYISSFQAVTIFRSYQAFFGRSRLMNVLLTIQFVLAFLTMIVGVILSQNARYQAARDWGYNQTQVISVLLEEPDQYAPLANRLKQVPDILEITGSTHHVGRWNNHTVLDVKGKKVESRRFDVGPEYAQVMGLRLKKGRLFDASHRGDASSGIIVNQTFVDQQKWSNPIGQQVRMDSTAYSVIGVVEDYHYNSFFDRIQPALLKLTPESEYHFLLVKTRPGAGIQVGETIEKTWKALNPSSPYEGRFQDQVFDYFFTTNRNILKIFNFTAFMALVISCMGLFGLVSQNFQRRIKEISIRKVLGATIVHVTSVANQKFVFLLMTAAVVATPVSYLAADALLDLLYEFRVDISAGPFLVAYTLVFVTAFATMASQLSRMIRTNPAQVLRTE